MIVRFLAAAAGAAALSALALPALAACELKTQPIPVTMEGLRPFVMPRVNGQEARFLLDSGAASNTINGKLAAQRGLKPLRIAETGTLLGSDIDPLLTDVSVTLGRGEVLVFYTDGVTEVRRRRQEVFGHRELVALLETCAGLPPDAVAERVEAAVLAASEGRLRDDVAILAFGPTPQPKETDG